MFSCSRADALGAPIGRLLPQAMQFIAPPADGALPSPAPRVLARARPLAARRANGEEFTAEASISRIDLGGRVLYALQLRDLSPRLAAEEERRALELQLRQSQKMEALGTLAGGIAHDFNNIVAAILGNAALAAAHLEQPDSARPFVAEISKAGLRARDVVQRIMAFSRKQAAVFSCQPLQPLVEEGVQLLRAMLPSGIEVVHDMPDEPMLVRADATQISQVLMNLGTNAWQALGSQPGRIVVTLDRDGDLARLSVSDSGCGMDEGTMQRIFEPFFTTKAKGEGTGLGLPVVHGIVHAHGGHIGVHSRKGEGTTFVIRLPLIAEAEAAAPTQEAACQAAAPLAGQGRHVVYLDDYPAMVFMMKATLEVLGYRVTGFEDATVALAYLDQHAGDVDLLVTDYNMPRHSGLELAERVRDLRPELPVILASGYITDELRREAAAIGVHHLFDKPRGIEDLCGLIGRVLAPQEACDAVEQAA
jgi:signal transduction histidine kinase/ActR/RegA family two-component response regulator